MTIWYKKLSTFLTVLLGLTPLFILVQNSSTLSQDKASDVSQFRASETTPASGAAHIEAWVMDSTNDGSERAVGNVNGSGSDFEPVYDKGGNQTIETPFVGLAIPPEASTVNAINMTIRVPQDQPTIQAGIDAAQDGDVVLVSPGTYLEQLTLSGKTITLASEFYLTGDESLIDQTIVDGQGGVVIRVEPSVGAETKIIGFTIRNGVDGVRASAQLHILNNRITGNQDGIDYESGGGVCRGNVLEGNSDDGVDLDFASAVLIEGNAIRDNGDDGIEIRLHAYSGSMLDVIIHNNTISGNLEDGIQLVDYPDLSDRVFFIEHNLITNNAMVGLGLMDNGMSIEDMRAASIPERVHVFNNTISGNPYALTGGDNLIALNNLFINSTVQGLKDIDGSSITAYNLFWNNGIDSTGSVVDLGTTLFADPFLDANYHLQFGSAAIDAGTANFVWNSETVLDLPPSEYSSVAPDLGWYESSYAGVPPPNLKLAFIGDQGSGSSATAVLQLIQAEGVDLVLHQGDFDYNDDPDAWDQKITDVLGPAFPYFVSVGNHDTAAWDGPNGYQAKFQQRLALIPDAHCFGDLGVKSTCVYKGLAIVLSGVGTLGSGHEAYIQQAFAADNHMWRICSWHKNMNKMQVGTKGDATGWGVYEACRQAGAIVATGHEHSYSRTYLMSSFENQVVANTSSTLVLNEGTSFAFVSGLGGAGIRNQDQDWPWMAAVYTSDQNANHGALFCTFNVNGQPNHADCYFKDVDGVVPDQFELVSNLSVSVPPNDPPVAVDDSASISEDTAVTINVAANDSDPEGSLDPASTNTSCPGCANPSDGILANNGDGTFTYTANTDFNGSDSFVYEICDTASACDTATVSITVDPVPDSPTASDDSASTSQDTAVTIDVAANDSDPDDDLDPASANTACVGCSDPTHGSLANNADGTFTYTPAPGFNGLDGFVYEICDGGSPSLCDTATVSITVSAVNDPPVANDDSVNTNEDTAVTIDVAGNDTDPDGDLDPTTANTTCANGSTGCGGPANGNLVNNGDGTFDYTPNINYNGPDSFVYEICDGGDPSLCDTATVSITVDPVPDSPTASDDSASTSQDTAVTIDVAANDSDPDDDLDPASANTACVGCSDPTHGSLANNADGTFTYTPAPGFNGLDGFVYEICDGGSPSLCDTATVSITVTAVNDPPVANDDSVNTNEDTAVTIDVAGNDTDPDGDLDPTTANTTCANGSTGCGSPTNGNLVNNGDGTFDYTPNINYNGPDSFVYEICDGGSPSLCDTATVNITVSAVNDPPVANDDSASTSQDTAVTIDVAANDSDPDDDLNPASANTACVGCSDPTHGSLANNADGTFTYTPAPGFNGLDGFVYEICDGGSSSLCDTATVSITVSAVNDPPLANDDSATTNEDTAVTIDVAGNDTDPDGDLDPTTTNITCANGSTGCGGPTNGNLVNNGDGTFDYTPSRNYHGSDSFVYEICDGGSPSLCDTATVSITVSAVNDPPLANDDSANTNEDTAVTIDVAGNDTDPDGDLDPTTTNTICANGSTGCGGPTNGNLVNNGDGTFDYTPNINYNGPDSFVYEICDGGDPSLCDTATVSITVSAVNDPPLANDDSATTNEDTAVTIDVTSNDTDPDGDLDPTTANTACANGSTGCAAPTHGNLVNKGDGSFDYTPSRNYHGSDSFVYEICDGGDPSLCDTATVSITVSAVNDPPLANDDSATTNEDTAVTIDVAGNDTDPDGDLDPTTANTACANGSTGCAAPTHGNLVNKGDGSFDYTPSRNYHGSDSFVYEICDGGSPSLCDTATVNITVDAVNDPPLANDDSASTAKGTLVNIGVALNDSDVDGNLDLASTNTTCATCSEPIHGDLFNRGNGSFDYTPDSGFTGSDSFVYEICDAEALCDTGNVTITVTRTIRVWLPIVSTREERSGTVY